MAAVGDTDPLLTAPLEADLDRVTATLHSEPSDLRILSWNIWFHPHDRVRRLRAIDDMIQAYQPHVMMMQEMTNDHLEVCKQLPGFSKFQWSPAGRNRYYTMIGSRLPILEDGDDEQFCRRPFEASTMARDLVSCAISHADRYLMVGTSHMESMQSADVRAEQLTELTEWLEENDNYIDDALWMGDTNVNSLAEDEGLELPDGWHDVWTTLRPAEVGETRPHVPGEDHEMLRIDRCRAKLDCDNWEMKAIEVLGTEPLPPFDGENCGSCQDVEACARDSKVKWISDHFGLLVTLKALD